MVAVGHDCREEAVGRGYGGCRNALVAILAGLRKVEEVVPPGLADSAADDGSAVAVRLRTRFSISSRYDDRHGIWEE